MLGIVSEVPLVGEEALGTHKLFIQFDDAPRAIPYGRADSGHTSATTIQAQGPPIGHVSMTLWVGE